MFEKLERDWINLHPVAFKQTDPIYNCLRTHLEAAWGFLLVRGAPLNTRQQPVMSRHVFC